MEFQGTPVIVLGMGRSGTSCLAGFLRSNGIDLGSNFIPPSAENPRGFFEDSEIVAFHRGLLKRLRATPDWDGMNEEVLPHTDLTEEEKKNARRILQRLAQPGLWGWKDPRTIHFIGFWLELLPDAKLIVPLRHPLEILYSHLKRIATIDTLIDVQRIFRAYVADHERILSIVRERPHKSMVVYTQNALSNSRALHAVLKQYLDLPSAQPSLDAPPFEPSEFTRLCIHREAAEIFSTLLPEAARAFDALNRFAHFSLSPCPAAPELRHFSSQLAAALRAATGPPAPETWLPLLIDLCRSGESPGYFALQSALLTPHAEAMRFWKTQSEAVSAELESHAALVREQSAWIGQLEEAKQFWIAQADSLRKELHPHAAVVNEPPKHAQAGEAP